MRRSMRNGAVVLASALLSSANLPDSQSVSPEPVAPVAPQVIPTAAPPVVLEPPPTKTVAEVIDDGVLITVSLASQQMHVFREGVLWRSTPVSTGKRGKETPPGVFAILQKKTFHRSNLYSNAPMPFMQRLTWDGIAIHAGRLPGYPASHGCIRIPEAFARDLFKITGSTSTAVIVVEEALAGEAEALAMARATQGLVPIAPELLLAEQIARGKQPAEAAPRPPAARTIAAPPTAKPSASGGETIQLAAAPSASRAAAQWEDLSARRPELRAMQMAIIPAVVNGRQYYRLRATAPGAHDTCAALTRAGIACMAVR